MSLSRNINIPSEGVMMCIMTAHHTGESVILGDHPSSFSLEMQNLQNNFQIMQNILEDVTSSVGEMTPQLD